MTGQCRCGQRIIFLKTAHGSKMPVNFDENIKPEHIFDAKQMTSHFATCPNAKQFRRPRKGAITIGDGTVVGPEDKGGIDGQSVL